MAFSEQLTDFFNNSEFSKTALWNSFYRQVIFDNAYAEAFEVSGSNPFITVMAADFTGAAAGQSVVIDAVSYTISSPPKADGTGILVIELEAV